MAYLRGPLVGTWAFLAGATVFSWWLGSESSAILILLVAIVKCRVVIRNYMEVRFAPLWLRLTSDAWLVLNFGMLASCYWFVR